MVDVLIYTDGGCSGNPGPGGWAFVVRSGGEEHSVAGGQGDTTNNRMELEAVIQALGFIRERRQFDNRPVTLCTDSQYVKNGITQWIRRWIVNGWMTAGKKPVKNKDLWSQVHRLNGDLTIDWCWVKGHEGNELNERCDEMVQSEIRKLR